MDGGKQADIVFSEIKRVSLMEIEVILKDQTREEDKCVTW